MSTKDNLEKEIKFIVTKKAANDIIYEARVWPGASYDGPLYELTTMFDTAEGRLADEDARLRLRQVGEGATARFEFSYKRRLPSTGFVKQEEEIETSLERVDAPHLLPVIFERMGYQPTTSYERRRTTVLAADVKITIDEFPFGYLLEIEGDESPVLSAVDRLGLKAEMSTPESCDDVYERMCRERGMTPSAHIRFDDPSMPRYED